MLWAKPRTPEELVVEKAIGSAFHGWGPARLTGISKGDRQQNIRALHPEDILEVREGEQGKILLATLAGAEIATLEKEQSARVIREISTGYSCVGVALAVADDGTKARPRIALAWIRRPD